MKNAYDLSVTLEISEDNRLEFLDGFVTLVEQYGNFYALKLTPIPDEEAAE